MRRFLCVFLILFSLLGLFSQLSPSPAQAEALPASAWYAVLWKQQADQLIWVNAQGSQATMARPKIPNEDPTGLKSVYFSRDGRSMVVVAQQTNGLYGIGFYNFEAAQFYAVHHSNPGEVLGFVRQSSTPTSDRFAFVLYTPQTRAYRFFDFELPTGKPLHRLTSADVGAPQMPQGTIPVIVLYDIDQATNKYMVHFQFKSITPAEVNIAYIWFANDVNNPIGPGAYKDNEFDIKGPDNRVAYGLVHPSYNFVQNAGSVVPANMIGFYYSGNSPQDGHLDESHILRDPKWLNNGQWLGYRVEADPVLHSHWEVKSLIGQTPNAVALGPNITNIWGTLDGYLALDPVAGKLFHNTQYQIEAFATEIGTSIYTYDPSDSVSIPYVTPLGSQFLLADTGSDSPVAGNPGQPGLDCTSAPPPRLTVGLTARVTFTNGASLNVRTEANGTVVATQLPEGTQVVVLAGPVCAGGYNWYQIQPMNGQPTGWSAEGAPGDYWLEPYITTVSPVPGNVTDGDCISAPPNYLQIGMNAKVGQLGGTLGMRHYPTDATVFHHLSMGTEVKIIGGPLCHDGWRFYQVSTIENGQTITGWVIDGLGSTQFLIVLVQIIID